MTLGETLLLPGNKQKHYISLKNTHPEYSAEQNRIFAPISFLSWLLEVSLGFRHLGDWGHSEPCTCLLLSQSASLSVSHFAHICQSSSFYICYSTACTAARSPLAPRLLSYFPLLHCITLSNGKKRGRQTPLLHKGCLLSVWLFILRPRMKKLLWLIGIALLKRVPESACTCKLVFSAQG